MASFWLVLVVCFGGLVLVVVSSVGFLVGASVFLDERMNTPSAHHGPFGNNQRDIGPKLPIEKPQYKNASIMHQQSQRIYRLHQTIEYSLKTLHKQYRKQVCPTSGTNITIIFQSIHFTSFDF